jgi:hypothetical protein
MGLGCVSSNYWFSFLFRFLARLFSIHRFPCHTYFGALVITILREGVRAKIFTEFRTVRRSSVAFTLCPEENAFVSVVEIAAYCSSACSLFPQSLRIHIPAQVAGFHLRSAPTGTLLLLLGHPRSFRIAPHLNRAPTTSFAVTSGCTLHCYRSHDRKPVSHTIVTATPAIAPRQCYKSPFRSITAFARAVLFRRRRPHRHRNA